jgi:hypothetical protein
MKDWRNWALALILLQNYLYFDLITENLAGIREAQLTHEINRIEMEYDIISVIRYGGRVNEVEPSLRQ